MLVTMLRLLVDKRFFQTLEEVSTKRQILTNAVPREIHSLGPHLEKLKFPYLLPQNLCTVDFKLKYTIWADLQAKGSQNNVIWSLTCVRGKGKRQFHSFTLTRVVCTWASAFLLHSTFLLHNKYTLLPCLSWLL